MVKLAERTKEERGIQIPVIRQKIDGKAVLSEI